MTRREFLARLAGGAVGYGFAAFPRDATVRLEKVRAFAPGEMAFLSGA
jgi:hypothetical protein